MQEPVVVAGPEGEQSTWTADVLRTSQAARVTLASLYVIGGFVFGTACIVVPGLHLITTWALPLGGILMAVRTMKRDVVIYRPQGPCPKCGQTLDLNGGLPNDTQWQFCPLCKTRLRFQVAAAT